VPTVLRDNGATFTLLTDDGREVDVAKDYAQPYLPPPSAGGEVAPPGAIDQAAAPPQAEDASLDLAPPGAWSPPPPVAPAPAAPPPETMAPPAPGESPSLGVPELTPPAPPPPAPPAAAPEPAPAVVPTQMPKTATQAAALGMQGLQNEADARQEAALSESHGAGQVVQAYDEAEQRLAEEQRLREQYQSYRQKEEAQLLASKKAMVDRYANFKTDRRRLFKEMSTGDQVLAGLSVALGQIAAAMQGQVENPALSFIMGRLDQDVQMQMAEHDALGRAIGMKQEEIADFRAVSSSRVGEYNTRMAAHLARLERDVAKIAARTQSETVKANAKAFTAQLQQKGAQFLGDAVTADRSFNEQVRARRAQIGMQRQNLVADMKAKGFVPDGRGGWVVDPQRPGPSLKEQEELRYFTARADKEEAEAKLKRQQAGAGPAGIPGAVGDPTRGGAPILNKDGSPWVPPTEKEQQEYRNIIPATQTVRRLADLFKLARDKYGGSSKLIGSPEYQEINGLVGSLDMEQKDILGLGVITGKDLEILERVRGGKDPTSFIYDATTGIEKLAERLETRTLERMRAQGFTGEWRPARVSAAESVELTPEQNVGRLAAPISTGARQDSPAGQALRGKEIEQKKAAVPALLRTKPSVEKLSEWGQKVEELRAKGDISAQEAIDIMNQTAPTLLREWKGRIQKMNTEQLLKEQQNPEFYKRATLLSLLESGAARPEEIYRMVVSGPGPARVK
jgi:hypothetical protein